MEVSYAFCIASVLLMINIHRVYTEEHGLDDWVENYKMRGGHIYHPDDYDEELSDASSPKE